MSLDYLSPINISSLARAIRYRHIPVAASITGFAILKVIILLSTGLLVLVPVSLTESYPVTLTTAFDGDHFWSTIGGVESVNNGDNDKISSLTAHAYLRFLRDNTTNTAGITNNVVFQSIEPVHQFGLRSISADVDAFVPDVSCEITNSTFRMRSLSDVPIYSGSPSASLSVQLDTHTCSVGTPHQITVKISSNAPVVYEVWEVSCSEASATGDGHATEANRPYDIRWAMLVSNISNLSSDSDRAASHKTDSQDRVVPSQTAGVLCKIDYSMRRSTLLQDPITGKTSLSHFGSTQSLNNLDGVILADMISARMLADDFVIPYTGSTTGVSPLFAILSQLVDGQKSMDRLLLEETLQSSATEMWAGLCAHFVQQNFLTPVTSEATGRAVRVEDRLRLGVGSLWTMVIGSMLIVLLTSCIMLTTTRNTVSQDPGLLYSNATILESSSALQALVKHCGSMRTSEITSLLCGIKFRTDLCDTFRITPVHDEPCRIPGRHKTKSKAWMALSVRYRMICLTLAMPMITIVALETLHRISRVF